MITKISLAIPLRSKPRGSLGKWGNITHSDKGYREWQVKFRFKLKAIYGLKPFPSFWAIVYIFESPVGKLGRKQDIDNLIGAINDALTPSTDKDGNTSFGWLKDDSWVYLPRIWGEVKSSHRSMIHLYLCESPLDFFKLFVKLYLLNQLGDVMKLLSNIISKTNGKT